MRLREVFVRALTPFRRRGLGRQTEDEMRFHLEMEAEAAMRTGVERSEAERMARIRVGSVTSSMEMVREQRGLGWLDGAAVDVRQAWKALLRHRTFLFTAGGTLAAGVAVNTLVFGMVYGVLLRPLPYREPERLVRVFEQSSPQPKFPVSIYNYKEDVRSNRTLAGLALYTREDMQLLHDERTERVTAVAITDSFFPTLGAMPALGRNFTQEEMVRSARVVILSYGFWANRLHADPSILGKSLRLDRANWTVVGVAPRGFQHIGGDYRSPLQGDTVAVWRPLPLDDESGCSKGCHYTNAVARLAPGVSMAGAAEDLNRIMDDLARRFPDFYKGKRARLAPLSAEVTGKARGTVLIIMAAGTLVLLLALINVAGLSIARILARRREFAIRRAVGGRTWRIARTVLAENLALGVVAGGAGLAVAASLLPALRLMLPANFPRLHELVFRWPDAVFALSAGLAAGAAAGLLAVFRETRGDPADALREDSRTASAALSSGRLRNVLVSAEMALACILCFAAGLLLRSAQALNERAHGFLANGVLTFEVSLPDRSYDENRMAAFYAEASRRLREIPGVTAAGFATSLPWTGYDENSSFDIEGYVPRPGESVSARYQAADPGFFDALGTRLVQGRFLSAADDAQAPKVILVNEALVRRYLHSGNVIDRVLGIWGAKRRIVGVLEDIEDTPADVAAVPAFWMPLAQSRFGRVRAAVRTSRDPLALAPEVRAALRGIDSELPIAEVQAMDDIAATALAQRRFTLWLCEMFAILAIVLAGVGVYAMLTYSVEQRRREIGIRLALGASRSNVLGTVFARGLRLAGSGALAGVLAAPAAGQLMSSLLYGVSPRDTITLIAAPVVILLIAALGCLAPGWAAMRNEPVSVLREQ
jgi:predicted permease